MIFLALTYDSTVSTVSQLPQTVTLLPAFSYTAYRNLRFLGKLDYNFPFRHSDTVPVNTTNITSTTITSTSTSPLPENTSIVNNSSWRYYHQKTFDALQWDRFQSA